MSTTTYWRVGAQLKPQVFALIAQRTKVLECGRKLARKHKAAELVFYDSWGRTRIAGFRFRGDPPDPKLFVRIKREPHCWRPRAGTPLAKELQTLHTDAILKLMDLIGMQLFYGNQVYTPGYHESKDGKQGYLVLPAHVKPKGCYRVSDIAFERAVKRRRS